MQVFFLKTFSPSFSAWEVICLIFSFPLNFKGFRKEKKKREINNNKKTTKQKKTCKERQKNISFFAI